MAVVAGQYEDAAEISADIRKRMIDQISPEKLEEMIKFNALRALSKSEQEWQSLVWPIVQKDVLNFISELNQRLGGDCNSLLTLKNRLERKGIETFGLTQG